MIDFNYGVKLIALDKEEHELITYKWRNNFEIWKWCRQNDLLIYDNHSEWFDRIRKDPTIKMYGIETETNEIIGVCGLTDIDRINQRAEFSLYIAPEIQRMGYGRKALKTLFSHGFLNQNLNLIWGETFDQNPALSLFKSLGMRVGGVRPQHYFREGNFIDAHLVSLSRDQFYKWKETLWV
jgi:RimJ/RimL family protein N-acetyltransferase